MKILLRKIAGEGRALICSEHRAVLAGGNCQPSILGALSAFVLAIILPLALLALTAFAIYASGDAGVLMAAMPAVQLRELKQKRGKAVEAARAINDAAGKENRALSDEEKQSFDKAWSESESLRETIEREERLVEAERQLAEKRGDENPTPKPEDRANETREERAARIMDEVRAMDKGTYRAIPLVRAVGAWFRDGFNGMPDAERRALEVGNSASGGYLQPPQEFVARLIQAVDNAVHIRGMATKFSVPKAESLGAPSLDNDPADPTWVGELNIGSEDSTMSFGKRELRPHPLAQFIKVSNTLLRKAAIDPEAVVRDRLAYKTGVVQENAFLNGNGAAQPLGVFTANAAGISTGRDVSTGNTSSSIQSDGLIEAKYSLKAQYWPGASWLFHRDAVKQIAKLKDGEGQYLWQPGLQAGQADRILSFPFRVSEYAPNTFTTGLYVGILGDFSFYWIADALDMQLQRLAELYAATNQTGFIVRSETDGMPVLEEAFVRVKLA